MTLFHRPYPIYAASGEGCMLRDVDGNSRIDFINNFTSLIHGHAHKDVFAAVTSQLPSGTAYASPTQGEIELAEELKRRVPSIESVMFNNSGSEAVLGAVRAARAFTGRTKIAKFEGAYHGCVRLCRRERQVGADLQQRCGRPRRHCRQRGFAS